MSILSWFLIGTFAAWVLTWSITVDRESEGPFRAYQFVRWFLVRPFIPALVRDNAGCPYCCSFWSAVLVTSLLPIYSGLSWVNRGALFFVVVYGIHGVIVFWFRYIKIFYGVSALDS